MSRIVSTVIAGVLLLGVGSIGASAMPRSEWMIGRPVTAELNLAQYNDRGRCFNTCVSGRIFRRCQVDGEGERENCCNVSCNRINNWFAD
jgi:hypothetical protein